VNTVATRRTPSTPGFQPWLLVAAIALGLALAGFAWYRVAHVLSAARPVKVPTIHPVSGVVWGGRVFSSRSSMAAWLHSRGASYSRWAERNPALARALAAP
jgi:hypothetical protein